MSIESTELYAIVCDHPGCRSDFSEAVYGEGEGGYMGRADLTEMWDENATEQNWKRITIGGGVIVLHYCDEHAALHDDATAVGDIVDPTTLPEPLFNEE